MKNIFDDVIFLISTDCFADELLGELSKRNIDIMKKIAREAVFEIIRGGDNYYLCADFSENRVKNTEIYFFARMKEENMAPAIKRKIEFFYNTLKDIQHIKTSIKLAGEIIGSIVENIDWINFSNSKISTPDTLIEAAKIASSLEPNRDVDFLKWKKTWLKSQSKWDKFLMSVMDEVPEVPYLKFRKIKELQSHFDFLYKWKKHLNENHCDAIRKYILDKAHLKLLNETDLRVATEVERIMSTF